MKMAKINLSQYRGVLDQYERALVDLEDQEAHSLEEKIRSFSYQLSESYLPAEYAMLKAGQNAVDTLYEEKNFEGAIHICTEVIDRAKKLIRDTAGYHIGKSGFYTNQRELEYDLERIKLDLSHMYAYLAILEQQKVNKDIDEYLKKNYGFTMIDVKRGEPHAYNTYMNKADEIGRLFPMNREVSLYFEAYKLYEEIKNPSAIPQVYKNGMANVYRNIGRNLLAKGSQAEAMRCYDTAMRLFSETGQFEEQRRIEAEIERLQQFLGRQ